MQNFDFYCKTRIIFGKDTESKVGSLLKEYDVKKVLLHYGGGHIKKNGLYDRVVLSLEKAGIAFLELGGVKANPEVGLVRKGIELCKKENIDFILAVGGGSVIDSAKAIGMGAVCDYDVWELYEGNREVTGMLPLATILTIPATGSEASISSVITNQEGQKKRAVDHVLTRPVFSILNPELTYSLPPYQTAMGSIDIMSHVFERYFTTEQNVELTDRMSEGVLKTVIHNLRIVLKEPENYAARAELMWAGTIAHNGLLGTGRKEDWASHLLGHEISGIYDLTHGATLAIMFPAWMKYVYQNDLRRFAQFAVRVWEIEETSDDLEAMALKGIDKMKEFFREVGAPVSFRDAGIGKEQFQAMAEKATAKGSIGGFMPINTEDALKIYELAY